MQRSPYALILDDALMLRQAYIKKWCWALYEIYLAMKLYNIIH
jgi:hypothetical protein